MQQQQQQIQNQFQQQLFQPNHQEHQLPSQQIPLLNSQAQTQAQPQPQLMSTITKPTCHYAVFPRSPSSHQWSNRII